MNHRFVQLTLMALAALILAACGQVPTTGVSSVEVTPESPSIAVGGTVQLTANVTADAGVDESVTWSSDPESVATVNASGLVTGEATGSAEVTATSVADPSVFDTVTVTVEAPSVTGVTIVEGAQTLREGATFDFSVDVDATGGADTSVTWSSSNDTVASVDADGVVTAEASGGPVTITATSVFDTSVTDTVNVTVVDAVFVDASVTGPGTGSEADPFTNIPDAIAAVEVGGVIVVASGTYSANLTVDKTVTLVGSNEGVDAGDTRDTESVVTGAVTIAGDGIEVVFDGFQFQSSAEPSIDTSGVDHNVDFVHNVFDGNFHKLFADDPLALRFESNVVNITQASAAGFLQISGDYDGSVGTSVTIADNDMSFDFVTGASVAINASSVAGTITNNTIDMTEIVAGQDNTRIALLIAGNSGDLAVENNAMANANQGIRFFSIGTSLGPVTIDSNSMDTVRQGIVVDATGDATNVAVTNNTIANVEEGIRLLQAGLSISTNTFNSASTAYVIDETGGYDLNAILADNTYTPAATVGTAGGFNAIVQQ